MRSGAIRRVRCRAPGGGYVHAMPRSYSKGGRAPLGPSPTGWAQPPGSLSLRERFGALRNLRPFLRLIWQTAPAKMTVLIDLRLLRALLPVASTADLTVLYEYLGAHADDDPATTQAVKAAAEHFEKINAEQQAADAASPVQ